MSWSGADADDVRVLGADSLAGRADDAPAEELQVKSADSVSFAPHVGVQEPPHGGEAATTRAEVRAWYSIDWGNSLYATVGIGGFLPLLLQDSALAASGFPSVCGNVCSNSSALSSVFTHTLTHAYALPFMPTFECAGPGPEPGTLPSSGCVATAFGAMCAGLPSVPAHCMCVSDQGGTLSGCPVSTTCSPAGGIQLLALPAGGMSPTSFATLSIALSTVAQAVVFMFTGAAADFGAGRKRTVVLSGLLGGLVCVLCAAITPESWWLGAPLMIVSNVLWGMSSIGYNAFLPVLVDNLPAVREKRAALQASGSPADVVAFHEFVSTTSSVMSNRGFAWGYAAGLVGIVLCIPWTFLFSAIGSYQAAMIVVGVWWLVFTWIPARWLGARPGPPLPPGSSVARESMRSTLSTWRALASLPVAWRFLVLWMVFSDGVFVIGTMGGLYANTEVSWGCLPKGIGILIMFIIVPIAAGIGNLAYIKVQERWKLSARLMLVLSLLCVGVIPFIGVLGFINPALGFRYGTQLLAVCGWYGIHLGAVQAYSRVIFAALIPPGKESAFFALYELTNRGSSWVGPLVLTFVTEVLRDIRWGWLFVLISVTVPALFVRTLDTERGRADALRVEQETAALSVRKA